MEWSRPWLIQVLKQPSIIIKVKQFVFWALLTAICMSTVNAVLYLFVVKPEFDKTLVSKMKAYGFLNNYVCWEDTFMVTLYTTDPKECSKTKKHPFFGIANSGVRAVPYRTVAVDPDIVPLGSVLVDAETGYIFYADDTGNAVKGRHIDLFIGQSTVKNNALMSKWNARNRQFFVIETRKKDLHEFPFKV